MSMIRAPLITSPWPLYSSIGILALVNNVVEYLWSNVVTNISFIEAYFINHRLVRRIVPFMYSRLLIGGIRM